MLSRGHLPQFNGTWIWTNATPTVRKRRSVPLISAAITLHDRQATPLVIRSEGAAIRLLLGLVVDHEVDRVRPATSSLKRVRKMSATSDQVVIRIVRQQSLGR